MAIQDKKIRSKVPITYNTGIRTQATSVLTGKILAATYKKGFTELSISFAYMDAENNVIQHSAYQIDTSEQIDGLFAQLQPLLPPPVTEAQDTLNKFYQGMLLVAADGWGTNIGDWEIVDDIYTVPEH